MNYSARFIEFPVIIVYSIGRDSELNEEEIPLSEALFVPSFARLNPLQIESYTPDTDGSLPDGEETLKCTRVFMRSGGSHIINMPINEFEAYLDEVYSKLYGQ